MKLLIIHLSDIHLRDGGNIAVERLKSVVRAVQNVEVDLAGVALVVSGDIAWSGKRDEYAVAKSALETLQAELREKTKVAEVRLIVVPGNHDCSFDGDDSARETIIQGIRKGTSAPIGASILNVCCEVHDNFFSFADSLPTATPARRESRVYYEYEWTFGQRKVLFRCYNTAWLSQRHEQQAGLSFPKKYIGESEPTTPSDYVVAVFHHPYNWFSAVAAREFRQHIEDSSDLIMTGHEHEADHYQKYSFKGEVNEYLEGAVFQEHGETDRSGFNAIWINLEAQKQKIITFSWDGDIFAPYEISGGWVALRRGGWTPKKDFDISPDFQKWLDDPGASFTHPGKSDLVLSDIFVFPNLREFKANEKRDLTYGGLVEGKDCLKVLGAKHRVLILARQQAGKTALSKVIFRDFYNKGITPVYLRGDDIHKSVELEKFETVVEEKFKNQYRNPLLPRFSQLDRDKALIIIDDFDHIPLNAKGRLKLLQNINKRFDRVCVLGDDALKFEEIAYSELSASVLADYAQYELLEFGHFLRSKLIEQWYDLGADYATNSQELAKKVHNAELLINSLIGRSYMSAFPIVVLSALQAADSSNPINSSAGTYGSIYEVLIIKALATKSKKFNIDTKASYLAEFAYWMFANSRKQAGEEEWKYFHASYCNKFKISPSRTELQREFEDSGLLERYDGQFRFRHSYAYYFFVARYLRDNLHQEPIKNVVASLCAKLHKEEHANIWLFLTHLSKDPIIVDVIVEHAKRIFSEFKPIEFGDDISFIQSLYDKIPEIILEDTEFRQQKESRLRHLDEHPAKIEETDDEEAERDEGVKMFAKLNLAFRTLEVLGQLVKNFPGSLVGTDKFTSVKECYLLGLRTTEMLFHSLREHADDIVAHWVEAIREQHPKLRQRADLKEKVRQVLFVLLEGVCFGTLKRISHAVGHANLEETYSEVKNSLNTNAANLIDVSIKLDTLSYPENQIKELKKNFRSNAMCDRLLRHLVVHYLYIFPTDERLKQRICAEMEIPIKRLRGLDATSQQQKRLPSPRYIAALQWLMRLEGIEIARPF